MIMIIVKDDERMAMVMVMVMKELRDKEFLPSVMVMVHHIHQDLHHYHHAIALVAIITDE